MKNHDKIKTITTNLLISFALISIGFMLGKHSVVMPDTTNVNPSNDNDSYIMIYYMHTSFRCVTCNTIEKMTKELLDSAYKKEMKEKLIRWQTVDFQENKTFAEKFKILSSCVVVAKMNGNKVIDYKRLDNVWTLWQKPEEFNQYISDAINSYLAGGKQ